MRRKQWQIVSNARRLIVVAAVVAVAAIAAPAAVTPVQGATCTHWDLNSDFGGLNPQQDSCGNSGVWYYLTATDPNARLPLYSTQFFAGANNLDVWYMTQGFAPFIGKNNTGADVSHVDPTGGFTDTVTWPAGEIAVYPQLNGGPVVVGWHSPIAGTVNVNGLVVDGDGTCGNGVTFALTQSNGATLASGNVANGNRTQAPVTASNVAVNMGDFIYLSIKHVSLGCNSTGLRLSIDAVAQATATSVPATATSVPATAAPTTTSTPANTATTTSTPTSTPTNTTVPSSTPLPTLAATATSGAAPTATSQATLTPAATSTPLPTTASGQATTTPAATGSAGTTQTATSEASTPISATSPTPTATVGVTSPVQVHNAPRTVRGGRSKVCDLKIELPKLTAGCVIISSISAPGATVVYTLTYPAAITPTLSSTTAVTNTDTFTDTADLRGHSLHIFQVAYLPPTGTKHGSALSIVRVNVAATLPDSTVLLPGSTRFSVIR